MVLYFKNRGEENTRKVLELCIEKARKLPSKKLIIPSTRGKSAELALELLDGTDVQLIVVTHSVGFKEPDKDEFDPSIKKKLIEKGYKILTTTHLFAGIDRALRKEFGGIYPTDIVATALKIFSPGTKVAFEISIMAADAGLVSTKEWVVSAGGTGKGLDTAYVLKPVHSNNFWELSFGELICIPSEFEGVDQ
ncbi:MAG: uncharacterized protein PWQ20_405 [Thermotogaceae bacterium]|nr:uncharacterized protein [Thermotogaceae bacterium]